MTPAEKAEWTAFLSSEKPSCCRPPQSLNGAARWFVVHRFYLEKGWTAKKVAALLADDWMFDQHLIYIIAGHIRKACKIAESDRAGVRKIDWELAQELSDEGMTTDELTAYFACARTTLEYSHIRKRPRRAWRRKRVA